MLIQISNRCDEGCAHCLQDSGRNGKLMSMKTFIDAVRFGYNTGWHVFLITGGEPTMNPEMENMLVWLDDMSQKFNCEFGTPLSFAIATNGKWIEDEDKRKMMYRISKLNSYLFTQVYTNNKWYKDYDFIQDWRTAFNQIPNCYITEHTIYINDLGRARKNEAAQREVEKNPYSCSCLNASLVAHQIHNPKFYGVQLEGRLRMCSPCVDYDGEVHMSESHLCPSVGNVSTESYANIYERMRLFKPCMRCKNSQRLLDDNPKMAMVREILGIEK